LTQYLPTASALKPMSASLDPLLIGDIADSRRRSLIEFAAIARIATDLRLVRQALLAVRNAVLAEAAHALGGIGAVLAAMCPELVVGHAGITKVGAWR
jgi:hypothetical protein